MANPPGTLVLGCLSLGDEPELIDALAIIRGPELSPHDPKKQEWQKAASLVSAYFERALLSPEGRRLYPEAAMQIADRLHQQALPRDNIHKPTLFSHRVRS
jgi:hypothetical protein